LIERFWRVFDHVKLAAATISLDQTEIVFGISPVDP
jgi:hypothetical protein